MVISITVILITVATIIAIITAIWTIVLGFQKHWAWGVSLLGLLLLNVVFNSNFFGLSAQFPVLAFGLQIAYLLAFLIFVIVAWAEAQKPFFWWLASWVLLGMAWFTLPTTRITSLGFRGPGKGNAKGEGALDSIRSAVMEKVATLQDRRNESAIARTVVPAPTFKSKLPPPTRGPGEPDPAAPGVFYMLERVKVTTSSGIQAANPGEEVRLLERLPGGKLHVTVGRVDFVVKDSQVTDDLNLARDAEKQDFVSRGGKL